jgi:hypothetical protein
LPLGDDVEFASGESLEEAAERISLEVEMDRGEQEVRRVGFLPNLEKKPEEPAKRAFTFDEDYLQQYAVGEEATSQIDPAEEGSYAQQSQVSREEHISSRFGELRFGQDYSLVKNDKNKKTRR